MRRTEIAVLLAILVLAAALRFVNLDQAPPGLYPDEAMNGTNALNALRTGDFRLFYPENNGREGLFINIQALSVAAFGNTVQSLRLVSALMGTLTVLGVYLLTRRLFDDWKIAAVAAFLMAVDFWHLNFSRIGWRAIMAPLCVTWGYYYLYKGIETKRLWHWGVAGFFWGLGFHTYLAFRLMPLSLAATLGAWWWALHAVFAHERWRQARRELLGGAAMLIGIMLLVILPLAAYFAANPDHLVGRAGQVSVFAADNPLVAILRNTGLTLGMFFANGDHNWRHNLAGSSVLFWPVAALFAAGLVRVIWRLISNLKHKGHPGVPQVMLLSWFVVGLAPGIISNEGIPHALRTLTASPAVYIMAALGLHWFWVWLVRWYDRRDEDYIRLPSFRHGTHLVREGPFVVGASLVVLLVAIGIGEYYRYFRDWAYNPATARAFDQSYVRAAARINALPPATFKYVVVRRGGATVDGISVAAQTVMYLTDTGAAETAHAKNVIYLTPEQLARARLPRGAQIIELEP